MLIVDTADCQFDVSGTYLLCAATVSEDRVELQLRETDRWSVGWSAMGRYAPDISHIERVGDDLIVVHPLHQPSEPGPDGRVKFEEWRDGLLCFPINCVLEQHGA
jgi:hypothetical protein